jgi:hypothetical protein
MPRAQMMSSVLLAEFMEKAESGRNCYSVVTGLLQTGEIMARMAPLP